MSTKSKRHGATGNVARSAPVEARRDSLENMSRDETIIPGVRNPSRTR